MLQAIPRPTPCGSAPSIRSGSRQRRRHHVYSPTGLARTGRIPRCSGLQPADTQRLNERAAMDSRRRSSTPAVADRRARQLGRSAMERSKRRSVRESSLGRRTVGAGGAAGGAPRPRRGPTRRPPSVLAPAAAASSVTDVDVLRHGWFGWRPRRPRAAPRRQRPRHGVRRQAARRENIRACTSSAALRGDNAYSIYHAWRWLRRLSAHRRSLHQRCLRDGDLRGCSSVPLWTVPSPPSARRSGTPVEHSRWQSALCALNGASVPDTSAFTSAQSAT